MLITIIECSSLRVICIKTHTHLLTPLPTFFSLSNRAAKSGDQIKALGESLLYQVSLRRSEPREAQCQQGAYRNTLRLHSVVKKAPFSCQEKKVQVQENQFLNNFSCSLSNRVVRLVFYVFPQNMSCKKYKILHESQQYTFLFLTNEHTGK